MKYCPCCGSQLQTRDVDGVNRQACVESQCGYVFWNNPVPVVAGLVAYEGGYVIANNTQWPKGIYSLITGYLEENETPEMAVLREVAEELGLQGEINRYIGHYSFFRKNQLILCFEVAAWGSLKLGEELDDVKVLSRQELSEYDFRPLNITEQIIRDWSVL